MTHRAETTDPVGSPLLAVPHTPLCPDGLMGAPKSYPPYTAPCPHRGRHPLTTIHPVTCLCHPGSPRLPKAARASR